MKKIIFGLSAVALMVSLAGCSTGAVNAQYTNGRSIGNAANNSSATASTGTDTSTEVEVVSAIFPGLEGIESTEFEVVSLGGSNDPRSIPGPTDYQYRGYIVLMDEAKEKLVSAYTWNDADPAVDFETITERSGDYKTDPQLIKDILKASYYGKVWLNEDGNTLMFDVHTL